MPGHEKQERKRPGASGGGRAPRRAPKGSFRTAHRHLWELLTTAAAIAVILFLAVTWIRYQERETQSSEAAAWREQNESLNPAGDEAEGDGEAKQPSGYGEVRDVVEYQGKTWRRNTYVKAILCMGVDRKEPLTEPTRAGAGGQADGIFLVAQDSARNTVKLLAIPRDTMTKITLTDLSGNVLGQDTQHLTLAYAYGDGRELSCQYMSQAVTELLGGLRIDGYMAVSMGALAGLNDAVGGVSVTVTDPELESRDPALREGETVTLLGDQAETYLRYRNIGEAQSAVKRLERQKSYITGFAAALRQKASREDGLALKLLDTAAPYMVTNLSKDQYLEMLMAFLNSGQALGEGDIETLPGEAVETELYDEYHPDPEKLEEMVLSLFYRADT